MASENQFSFRVGEDTPVYRVALSPRQDITGWGIQVQAVGITTLATLTKDNLALGGVTLIDLGGGVFGFQYVNADTKLLTPDTFLWKARRIDAGFNTVYAEGSFYLLP